MVVVPYVKGYLSDRDEKAFLSLANDLEQDYPGHNIIFLGLVGSHAARDPDDYSDIDVFVIIEELEIWKHGKTIREGIELEYFIYPPEMVIRMMEKEGVYRPVTAHMLHQAKFLLMNNEKMTPILDKAESIIIKSPNALTDKEKEQYKFELADLVKDLRDVKDPLVEYLIRSELINLSIEIFLRSNQTWRERIKEVSQQLELLSPHFLKLLKEATHLSSSFGGLVDYVDDLLGGTRKIEWVEEGKV